MHLRGNTIGRAIPRATSHDDAGNAATLLEGVWAKPLSDNVIRNAKPDARREGKQCKLVDGDVLSEQRKLQGCCHMVRRWGSLAAAPAG